MFVVGDTPQDVLAATANELKAIAVMTGGFTEHELKDAGALLVLDSVSDINYLGSMSSNEDAIAA
ncbi:HAD family hydrolase [Gordonia bronchialis]|uniref:HAD family hydrolase n=1 Tax=Gordonia bronchialis TaxID=2054 RepID=UPI001D158BD6|nr:HAD hydrolase-like protein [Gordonia bronchialis]MCC3323501.1 HAD hydrolase-like protein [Gordonia bronchialis]